MVQEQRGADRLARLLGVRRERRQWVGHEAVAAAAGAAAAA